jgi:hypothetical protein
MCVIVNNDKIHVGKVSLVKLQCEVCDKVKIIPVNREYNKMV